MIKLGKEIFENHVTQLMTIIVSLALAIVAKKLTGDIASLPLIPFLMDGFQVISTNEQLSVMRHVLIPFVMYLLSCSFLLWMGITNLVTFNEKDAKFNIVLKVFLGFWQLFLFGVLLLIEARLFTYFMVLVFTMFILIEILNYAATVYDAKYRKTELIPKRFIDNRSIGY